jgi:magnesium chelatase family protein
VRESRERVRAAIQNSGFEFPQRRITANLAPAYLRKAGPGFDLAVAVGILAASGQVPIAALERWAIFGELSLGGELRPCGGTLAVAEGAARRRRRADGPARAPRAGGRARRRDRRSPADLIAEVADLLRVAERRPRAGPVIPRPPGSRPAKPRPRGRRGHGDVVRGAGRSRPRAAPQHLLSGRR